MKILVTGSSGTIGTHLCERLFEQGHEVVGADWKPNTWNTDIDARTISIDLRDKQKTLALLPNEVDAVIHLAANARVYDLIKDPSRARDNIETVFNVLEYARARDVQKFLFASSREVYGNLDKPACAEDDARIENCENAYAASKMAGEALIRSYHRAYGLPFSIFRYANVYGMYDESDRIIPLFIRKSLAGEELTIFGEDKILDFTHITDAVTGTLLLLDNFDTIRNDVYNIATSVGTSLTQLAELIRHETGATAAVHVGENRPGEVMRNVADIAKIRTTLSYEPSVSMEEGIRRSVTWYKELATKK